MPQSGSATWRAKVEERPEGLNVTIPREFNPLGTILLSSCFAIIYLQGRWIIDDIRSAVRSYPDFIALVIWLAILALILRAVLWSIWGLERIFVDGKILTIRREILALGMTRAFELAKVDGLRIFVSKGFRVPILNPQGKKALGLYLMSPDHRGTIVFEYKAKTYAFGIDLPEEEARRVIKQMEQYSPSLSFH